MFLEVQLVTIKILNLVVLALVGFIARRLNVITAEINSAIVTIVIKITTPFLILVTLSNFCLTPKELQNTFKDFSIFVNVLFKLLLIPIGVMLLLLLFGVTGIMKQVIVMQSAMSCAVIVATLAKQYDSDHEYAARCIFVSTILCVLTIPLLVWILR